ncbi:DUF2771 family protein [Tsukamurella pseudospumae]|uniref:DUF2771 domain-containing protein n=1 Tax=Tsukamurella pseudospumae TaxID=239498 RepID=A0A137YTN3_9ACTN|nr:DUF2771 family protein [Tsukamurella pseudospumae]KXO89257.1 hypothetical protein AXK61_11680 [Tsukamurella pseudospumae]
MIKPSRNVLIAGVVFIVAAAVLFAFTISAALDKRAEPKPRPALSAAVGGQYEQVAPMQFCADVRALQCDQPRKPARMSVEPGQALVISLPEYITKLPWFLTVQRYDTKLGKATLETITHLEPERATLVLKSTHDLLLAAVEINVPSAAQDSSGAFIAQAVWGIDTLAASVTKDFALVQKP